MKILQVAAEHYGLAKTGGLADMVASLSSALKERGADVRACLPAYAGTIARLEDTRRYGSVTAQGHHFDVIEGRLPGCNHQIVLLDCPELFNRPGDPYRDANGKEFDDIGWRFGCFNEAVASLVRDGLDDWHPELVHLHDWHTGLTAALLKHYRAPVKTVFTIHNFSFHGVFDRSLFDRLGLPAQWWHPEEIEFYGNFSFMKAGLKHADIITAVSPRYADEIHTPEFGAGLEGVVQKYENRIRGIVNGIDQDEWNPSTDKYLAATYNGRTLTSGKRKNKAALQKMLGLPQKDVPLLIFIGRLADQKGPDLILAARQALAELPVQLIILGSGDQGLEEAFKAWAVEAPEQVATVIDVDEKMAHTLTAAADMQLMPSRFEPCGLSQMYAQRYGTFPVARATGGLADTITDATPEALASGSATGFLFSDSDAKSLIEAVNRALEILKDNATTRKMRQTAMKRDFSWALSAQAYLDLYRELLPAPRVSVKTKPAAALL